MTERLFRVDVGTAVFSLLIPRDAWENIRTLQNDDFARFVESRLKQLQAPPEAQKLRSD
jgi:hypothetical protein